jgi:sn-glycerol 3-phosphate transport system ATP-binding protein
VFLFDEPLSNLDAKLRVQMRLEIKDLQSKLGITSLYVTHDQVEAMTMADRMIVMNAGVAEQIGTPLDVYERPRTLFAAQFIGSPSMNVLSAQARDGQIDIGGAVISGAPHASGPIKLGIRPEHLTPDPDGPLEMQVKLGEPLGANTLLHGTLTATGQGFTASLPGVRRIAQGGERLTLGVDPGNLHVFHADTGARIE